MTARIAPKSRATVNRPLHTEAVLPCLVSFVPFVVRPLSLLLNRRTLAAAILLAACHMALAQSAPAGSQGVYLIITRPMFTDALAPLIQRRTADGFTVSTSTDSPDAALRSLAGRPAMILLVGDDSGGAEPRAENPWSLPARRVPFYRWRAVQAEDMPTDAAFGDLDADGIPDVPVGRLPVRSVDQLAALIAKIVAYEDAPPRLDDLTIPLWAGTADAGPTLDAVLEAFVSACLESFTPPWVQPWVIFGREGSPLCYWPPMQASAFQQHCRDGGAVAWLIGHGSRDGFYSMEFQGRTIAYDVATVRATLTAGPPTGPLIILACSCGDFTGRTDCFAEALLHAPGGPVAVVAATTESHPLPNFFTAQSAIAALGRGPQRLGDLWLAAQLAALRAQSPVFEAVLAPIEGTLEATLNTGRLRRDQLLLYALLGDPATRLRLPAPLHGRLDLRPDGWYWTIDKPPDADTLFVSFRYHQFIPPAAGSPRRQVATLHSLGDGARADAVSSNPQSEIRIPKSAVLGPQSLSAESAHRAALARYDFAPVATFSADQPWTGRCTTPGLLRLVAVGPRNIYAVALPLGIPTSASAPTSTPSPATP